MLRPKVEGQTSREVTVGSDSFTSLPSTCASVYEASNAYSAPSHNAKSGAPFSLYIKLRSGT
ncbi:hypothetical protein E2C01_036776 [Portunus trituberculatus]|uniref:Uncharacterized protein n=1 Tax=Portunus trituberculatus TaxID=210409 RepID=A0A5B7FDK5_PORTR|nr:hypothetical protein [Portunus trituberculatus]